MTWYKQINIAFLKIILDAVNQRERIWYGTSGSDRPTSSTILEEQQIQGAILSKTSGSKAPPAGVNEDTMHPAWQRTVSYNCC